VDAVLTALDALHVATPRSALPTADERQFGLDSWPDVAADPAPFLATGICSPEWLTNHLPALATASAAARIDGDHVLHFDVRSDNLCFTAGRALFVDWNHACLGNPVLDTASWLPSLEVEGGPAPEDVLAPDTPELAEISALLAGYFCARAGLPEIPQAPHVRRLQLDQGRVALAWACRELGISPPA
jgi:aminoglycoside phosphotransferase (APT) family kinase protein